MAASHDVQRNTIKVVAQASGYDDRAEDVCVKWESLVRTARYAC